MIEPGAWVLRTETELIIKSRRANSRRLGEAGFTFSFSDLEAALQDCETRVRRASDPS